MKITYERVPASAVKFTIEVPADVTKAAYDKITRQIFTSVQIPGFRKGKAPKELALRFTGADKIHQSVFEKVMEDSLKQALRDHSDLQIIGNVRPESSEDDLMERFQVGADFTYTVLVDAYPEIKLGQYKGLTLEVVKKEPDFATVDQRLQEFRINKSTLVPIEDRPVQTGDVVIIDMDSYDMDTKEKLGYLCQEDWHFDLDEGTLFDEIYRALLGVRVGDLVEAVLSPSEDIGNPNPVRSVITVKDIKHRELPPLDDEFARSISTKETMAELRQFLEEMEVRGAEMRTETAITEELLAQILDQMEIELPESMVRDAVERALNARLNELEGFVDDETIKEMLKNEEICAQMVEAVKPDAIASEKIKLALLKVAELEDISVDRELVDREYQRMSKERGAKPSHPQDAWNAIHSHLVRERVLQFLKENSTIVLSAAEGQSEAGENILESSPIEPSEVLQDQAESAVIEVETVTVEVETALTENTPTAETVS